MLHRTDQFQAAVNNGEVIALVGAVGTVLTSQDQGASWSRQQIGRGPALIDITACPDGTLVASAIRTRHLAVRR